MATTLDGQPFLITDITGVSDPAELLLWIDENLPRDVVTKHLYAGENLGSSMGIRVGSDGKAYKFDITDPSQYNKYLGVSSHSTNTGAIVKITLVGLLQPPGTWVAGTVYYIGLDSYLTSTTPGSGLVKVAGVGVDANRLVVLNNSTGSGGSTATTSNVLIDCGTILTPGDNVLIDCGTIL